jgi:hypothetical protein
MAVRLEATPPRATARRRRFRYTLPGAWLALVFAWRQRWMGRRAARGLGWVAGTYLVASGLLANGLAALADRSFSVRNTTTAEGVERPTSGLRSGGPGSM